MREDKKRLGNYIRNERVNLGYLTLQRWADRLGISERTLGKLERGYGAGPTTLAVVENALGWTPGDCMRIAYGQEPRRRDPVHREKPLSALTRDEAYERARQIEAAEGRDAAYDFIARWRASQEEPPSGAARGSA